MGPALCAGVCEVLSSNKFSGLGSSHRKCLDHMHWGTLREKRQHAPGTALWEVTVSVTLSLIRKVLSHDVQFFSSDSSLIALYEENPQITSGQQGRETLGWDSRRPRTTLELQPGNLHHVPG